MKNLTFLILALCLAFPFGKIKAEYVIEVTLSGTSSSLDKALTAFKITRPNEDGSGDRITYEGFTGLRIKGDLKGADFGLFKAMPTLDKLDISQTNLTFLPPLAFSETVGTEMRGIATLEEVSLPGSLREIGYGAFANCANLKRLNLEACGNLTTLHAYALFGTGMEELRFGPQLQSVGLAALANNLKIQQIMVDPTNPYLQSYQNGLYQTDSKSLIYYPFDCRQQVLQVKPGMESIEWEVFKGQPWLEEVVLPTSMIGIVKDAFSECRNLKRINFPAGLLYIGEGVFNATALETVDMSGCESLTSVGNGAFADCVELHTVILPQRGELSEVGNALFKGCEALKSIILPAALTVKESAGVMPAMLKGSVIEAIEVEANHPMLKSEAGVVYSKDFRTLYLYPPGKTGEFILNPNVEVIEASAVSENPYLTEIRLDAPLHSFSDYVFCNLPNLVALDLPASIQAMPYTAKDCESLRSVTLRATQLPAVSTIAFGNCHPDLIIYVPEEQLSAYRQHEYWGAYSFAAIQTTAIPAVESAAGVTVRANEGVITISSDIPVVRTEIYDLQGSLCYQGVGPTVDMCHHLYEPMVVKVYLQNGASIRTKLLIR